MPIEGGRSRDDRGWGDWMASLSRWTWVWVNSRSWWWTGRPSVLQSMGSQRIGHDWVTELNWTELMKHSSFQRVGQNLITSRTTEPHLETTWCQIKEAQALKTPWSLSAAPHLNHRHKISYQIPLSWDTGHEPVVSPFAWQSNKAILFASSQTLSLRVSSALVYRGCVLGISLWEQSAQLEASYDLALLITAC